MLGSALRKTLRAGGAESDQLVRREPAHCREMHWEGKRTADDEKFRKGLTTSIHLSGQNLAAH
jgi:NAD dependent epimerase/dehydratase family enzyme